MTKPAEKKPEGKSRIIWMAEHLLAPILVGAVALVIGKCWSDDKVGKLHTELKNLEIKVSKVVSITSRESTTSHTEQKSSVLGEGNRTTQIGTLSLGSNVDLRNDPPEIASLSQRINEGEELVHQLSRCKYDKEELEQIIEKANTWLQATDKELGDISETVRQLFHWKPPPGGLRTIMAGCSRKALNAKDQIEVYVNNLRTILPRLAQQQ